MSQQLRFFRKNLIDRDSENAVTFTITDNFATNKGDLFTKFLLNRDNTSGWATTGSTDAANTTMELQFNGVFQFDTIILTGHNLKSYTLQYWNEDTLAWADFSTPVAPSTNEDDTTFHQFTTANSSKLKLVIAGTQVADSDKRISQFIVTRKIRQGQLEGWPIMKKPTIDLSKKPVQVISGKSKIIQRVGAYAVDLDFSVWPSDEDLTLLEELHFFNPLGFLFWPSAGDESQFRYKRHGYRNKDIYLCGVRSEWRPEWEKGIYVNGMGMKVQLIEVI